MKLNLFLSLLVTLAIGISGCQAKTADQIKPEKKNQTSGEAGKSASVNDDSEETPTDKPSDSPKENAEPSKKAKPGKIESIYTSLDEKICKTINSNEQEEWVVQECPGVAGYKLEVTEGDLRQTINVIAPSGGKYELDFQTNISPAFSYLGKKAEWRVKKVDGKIQPIALIVRFNASEDPENADKVTSYLVVTKFEGEFVCITDVVKPIKNANVKARELADASAGKPCLKGNR